MPCLSDTDHKRLARFYLYRRIKRLWKAGGAPTGQALVLAGDEASEIGCLRDYLGRKGEDTHFIDVAKNGLGVVEKEWPEAQTFFGQLEDAIISLRGDISLINLDFCGYLKEEVVKSIEAAADKIVDRGIVAYTFVRDREHFLTPNWQNVQDRAKEFIKNEPQYKDLVPESPNHLDTVRFLGYSEILRSLLGEDFTLIFTMRYGVPLKQRNMGIVALQKMPTHLRVPAWRKELMKHLSSEERTGTISNHTDLRERLRQIAMNLTDTLSPKQVAAILHLPIGTLAAWQAHKTRGTYL